MLIVHLTASTFFGGPERQMVGLATGLPAGYRTQFLSFAEGGRCAAFLEEVRKQGFEAAALNHDTPRIDLAARELVGRLKGGGAAVLCCHGYKADLIGRWAARRAGIPVVAVSRGWTAENFKVRVYERLDRLGLRWMDRVVCVSEGQAVKVRRAGVPARKVLVIRNAIQANRFRRPDPACREELQRLFRQPRTHIVGAAGRLSPEKGFDVLIEAAALVAKQVPSVGFVLFGDGPLRDELTRRITAQNLDGRFVMAGFRTDLDRFFPSFDLLAQSSHTEGMPNVVLEASAAGTPVVATAVGGTPEVVADGVSGHLVLPGSAELLAGRIRDVLLLPEQQRRAMGGAGRQRVLDEFTFAAQAGQYQILFEELAGVRRG
ncbi:MAG: glycosyltransferase [Planctomycetes bacterium]|nr:glycosyltransferase [Planctomycetota bacterium]